MFITIAEMVACMQDVPRQHSDKRARPSLPAYSISPELNLVFACTEKDQLRGYWPIHEHKLVCGSKQADPQQIDLGPVRPPECYRG